MTSSVSRFVSAPATTALAPALCSDCAMNVAELTSSTYHLLGADPERTDELKGKWSGPSGGMAIGAVSKTGKNSFFQTSVEFMQHVVANSDDPSLGKRRFDSFALSVQYVFNSEKSYLIENSILGTFLDSMAFF